MERSVDGGQIVLIAIVTLVSVAFPLGAQTPSEGDGAAPNDTADDERSLFDRTILQDLETAGNAELIDWAITLNLSTQGTRLQIEDRILEYYGLNRSDLIPDGEGDSPPSGEDGDTAPLSIATIRNARGSDYFTIDETDERYLRLIGGVELTMEDDEAVHRIVAEELTLNLEQNTISAIGRVEYTVERPGETESFRGDSIVFNIADWDGVFLRGVTESGSRIEEEEVDFTVSGERISRSPQDIVVIDDGVITSSTADPPNYEIRARRIWILAPGEWGIRRAVLYVGRVPMFYFPYFFIPGDRLFFNPAVGSRSRAGTFIMTTTYLFGQSEEDDPPFSIMQIAESPDDSERVIQGLFLRIPEEPKEVRNPDWSLKLMVDAYTKLGNYGGVAGSLPGLGPFSQLDFRAGIAASRNIYFEDGSYSSFYVDEMGRARRRWNEGYFLNRTVPYRYETDLAATLDIASLTLSLDYELLSDTRFKSDFGDRAESIDWNRLITQSGEPEDEEDDITARDVTSLRWESQLRWNPSVPALQPWVSSFGISSLRTELRWSSRENAELPDAVTRPESDNTPERLFFYPESAVFPDLVVQMNGTLLRIPGDVPEEDLGGDGDDDDDGDESPIRPPWEEEPDSGDQRESAFRLPDRAADLPGIDTSDTGSLTLGYSLRPTVRVDRITDSDDWDTYDDVGFQWRYSTLQNRNRGNLNLGIVSPGSWVRYDGSLVAEQRYQSVDFLTEVEEAEADQLRQSAFAFRGATITQSSTTTGYPLKEVYALEETTLQHEINSRVYERRFLTVDESGNPEYETRYGDWSDEGISRHAGIATIKWRFLNAAQTFRAESILPPLDRGYLGAMTLVTGPLTSTLTGGYRETEEEGWKPDPMVQTHTLSFFDDDLSAEQRLEYDLEENDLVQARSVVTVWPLRVDLQGQRTTGIRFVEGSGWTDTENEGFYWTTLAVGLEGNQRFRFWKRRVDVVLNGALAFETDLQEFTRSSLLLNYGFDLDIYRFLTVEFAARSRNDLIYQYAPRLAKEVDRPPRDPVEDLVNSLRLFDAEARRDSFFKIESIEISAVHDLQDWDLTFTYIGGPELVTAGGTSAYEWRSVFAVLFEWRAISEIRRDMRIEDGTLEFVES